MIEAVAFLFGLLIGSFLNVCAYRLPRDLSVVRPRSFCPSCFEKQLAPHLNPETEDVEPQLVEQAQRDAMIAWYDNIPLVSYLLLAARCRRCRAAIPWRYPVVELMVGLLFAWCVYAFGPTPEALKYCIFSAIMVTLMVTDIETMILPDEFTLGGTLIGFVLAWLVPLNTAISHLIAPAVSDVRVLSLIEAALGALIGGGSLLAVAKVYEWVRHREGMGLGDVKMVLMIGAFLGLQGSLLTLILGSLAGGIGGLAFILLTGRDAATYQIPFGAFLGASSLTVAMFGQSFMTWYLRLGASG